MAKYLLGDRAAAWLKAQLRDANAVQLADVGPTRKARVAGVGGVQRFHFAVSVADGERDGSGSLANVRISVAGGAVQVGGYTYFVEGTADGAELVVSVGTDDDPVEALVCVKFNLSGGTGEFVKYDTEDDLRSAQDDMDYYIWPLCRIVNGVKTVDYRPMPNAGCWETCTSLTEDS